MPPFSLPGQFWVSCTPFPNDILCVEARLDGTNVLRTRLDAEAISLEEAEEAYKGLALVEQARKEVKHDLAVRLVFHQVEERIEAQILGILMSRPLSSPLPLPLRGHAASFDRGCPAASFPDSFVEQRRLSGRNVVSKSAQRASQLLSGSVSGLRRSVTLMPRSGSATFRTDGIHL